MKKIIISFILILPINVFGAINPSQTTINDGIVGNNNNNKNIIIDNTDTKINICKGYECVGDRLVKIEKNNILPKAESIIQINNSNSEEKIKKTYEKYTDKKLLETLKELEKTQNIIKNIIKERQNKEKTKSNNNLKSDFMLDTNNFKVGNNIEINDDFGKL